MFYFHEEFKNHQSIKLIKGCFLNNCTFSFDEITRSDIEKELKNFDSSKVARESDIPTKIIKDNIEIFTPVLHQELSKSIETGKFPSEMKSADVTPVFKACVRYFLTSLYFPPK